MVAGTILLSCFAIKIMVRITFNFAHIYTLSWKQLKYSFKIKVMQVYKN